MTKVALTLKFQSIIYEKSSLPTINSTLGKL
ncbi:MAG: hypothetical protein ACI9JY_000995, partial [Saprospiraceae bacterium]